MRRGEFWLFGGAIVVLALDQITKAMVVSRLPLWQPWNPVRGMDRILSFTRITNTGVAFGLFPQAGMLFSIIPVLVVLAILVYYRKMSVGQRLLQVTLGLQLGGALGNLVDRLRLGYVVDPFIAGSGMPDLVMFDGSVLQAGDGGVRAAGWFDWKWEWGGGFVLRGFDPAEGR